MKIMSERALASIQQISELRPIQGADKIECAVIKGWTCVVGKDDFKVGDLCVFFEIDSFIPSGHDRYKFLEPRFIDWRGKRGARIKTMRLRGQLSQGLALPLSSFNQLKFNSETFEPEILGIPLRPMEFLDFANLIGHDLTDHLGVEKWEPNIPAQLAGKVRGNFPSFLRKTDQERIQNIFEDLKERDQEETYQVTQKLDGSSMTVYLVKEEDEWRFGVCSRNLDLTETEDNLFWKTARETDLEGYLRRFVKGRIDTPYEVERGIALQGELMGPGVQGNPEKLTAVQFYLFDMFNIDTEEYFNPGLTQEFAYVWFPTIKHVPVLEINASLSELETIEKALEMAEIPSIISNNPAEGIVFKKNSGRRFTFKIISNKYLLAE